MWQRNLFSVSLVFVIVSCEKDMKIGSRKARLFTFNTVNDDIRGSCTDSSSYAGEVLTMIFTHRYYKGIRACEDHFEHLARVAKQPLLLTVPPRQVDLDFSIPFLSIPVKPTMENVFGSIGLPSVNVNLPALVLGGGVVLASTFLLPLLFKTYSQQPPYDRYAKILEHTQFGADTVLDFASSVLSGGVQGCALRLACWSGQREREETAKFWTGVMSNHLVSTLVNSTAVEDAIASGQRGRDCSVYSPCPLTAEHYTMLMRNLIQLSNANS